MRERALYPRKTAFFGAFSRVNFTHLRVVFTHEVFSQNFTSSHSENSSPSSELFEASSLLKTANHEALRGRLSLGKECFVSVLRTLTLACDDLSASDLSDLDVESSYQKGAGMGARGRFLPTGREALSVSACREPTGGHSAERRSKSDGLLGLGLGGELEEELVGLSEPWRVLKRL